MHPHKGRPLVRDGCIALVNVDSRFLVSGFHQFIGLPVFSSVSKKCPAGVFNVISILLGDYSIFHMYSSMLALF